MGIGSHLYPKICKKHQGSYAEIRHTTFLHELYFGHGIMLQFRFLGMILVIAYLDVHIGVGSDVKKTREIKLHW